MPSISEAWLAASLKTVVFLFNRADRAWLAWRPEGVTAAASVPRKAARRASSSVCSARVPFMARAPDEEVPNSSRALTAAPVTRGSECRLR
ncbi:hypothetical protein SGRIM128S_03577 [Streptomyces griseomycini]